MHSRLSILLVSGLVLVGCKKTPPGDKGDKAGEAKKDDGSAQPGGSAATPTPGSDSAVAPKPAAIKTTTPDAKLKRYNDCWAAFNAGKDDVFSGCFAADSVRENVDSVPELSAKGPAKIVDMAKSQKAAFPDLTVTPQLVIVSGNTVAAILHVTGTNTADAGGMKATGKKLGVFEAELAVIGDDGTFSHDSFYVDQPTIYHQLGLLENDSSPSAIMQPMGELVSLITKDDATEKANAALVQSDMKAVTAKDDKAIEAVAADDIKFTYHGDKQKVESKKAYMKWIRDTLKSSKKDAKVDVKGLWAAGNFVVVSDVFTGTPTEKVPGAGNKHIETQVVQFFQIADGKIKQHHIFANRLKTAVQLGVIDPDQLAQALSAAAAGDTEKPKP